MMTIMTIVTVSYVVSIIMLTTFIVLKDEI